MILKGEVGIYKHREVGEIQAEISVVERINTYLEEKGPSSLKKKLMAGKFSYKKMETFIGHLVSNAESTAYTKYWEDCKKANHMNDRITHQYFR